MASDAWPARLGRYEMLEEVGRGPWAVVFKAHDPALDRLVAIKAIAARPPTSEAEGRAFEERFLQEARLAARLNHPGLVPIHDAGKDEATGVLYVVFEYLEATPLSDTLVAGRTFAGDEALRLTARLAEALQHAHANGLVHRDMRPANILLTASGEPRLAGLGVARVETSRMTVSSLRQASVQALYTSPEQAVGERVDARSDLFSLGAIAYRLLTGADAFAADDPPSILARVIHDSPTPPSQLASGLPAGVDGFMAMALAKPRKDRYQDARSMAEDAEDLRAGQPPRHAAGRETAGGTDRFLLSGTATGTAAGVHNAPRHVERRSMVRAVAGAAALLLVGGLELLRRRGEVARVPHGGPVSSGGAAIAPAAAAPAPSEAATSGLPSLNEPTPAPLARVTFDLAHSLQSGHMVVTVDGNRVIERRISGARRRSFLVLKSYEGRVRGSFEVPPGRRRIGVQVTWDDNQRSEAIGGTFAAGSSRRLSARLGGLRKSLSLSWR